MANANLLLLEIVDAARKLTHTKNPFSINARVCFFCGGHRPHHAEDCAWDRLDRLVNERDHEEEE